MITPPSTSGARMMGDGAEFVGTFIEGEPVAGPPVRSTIRPLAAMGSVASKRCPACCPPGVALPASAFPRNRAREDGLGSLCRGCKNAVDRRYWRRNANRLKPLRARQKQERRARAGGRVYAYLLRHPCVDCGEADPVVLEFDHVRGGKLANVSLLVADGFDWRAIAPEIEKCEVRCANCHRRREARLRQTFRERRRRERT